MFELVDGYNTNAVIKVIGVGGGGGNAVSYMMECGIDGVEFICANTDSQALKNSRVKTAIQIGCNITKGLGAGANPDLGRQAAMEDRDRLREAIELMRQLWSEDRVNYRGQYYSTHDASIYDRPEVPVPIYVAAGGPFVAKFAGKVGDGFICTSGKGVELYTEKLIPAVMEGIEQAGKSADDVDRMIEIKLSYDTDYDVALNNTRFWSPLSLSAEQKHDITDPIEMEQAADALPIEQIAKRWIVGNDPDAVVAEIAKYIDYGMNHLVFHAPGQDQRRFLELFERDLAPRLRGLA